LAPGDTRTIQIPVPATWAAALQVDVTVGSMSQAENDCLDPERKAGDDCESNVGELAGQLTGTVTLGLPDGPDCTPAQSGELSLLGTRTTRLTAASPGVRCLFVELTLRDDALNNQAQSDSLILGLDLVARDFLAVEGLDVTPTDGPVDRRAPSDNPPGGSSATDGGTSVSDQSASGQDIDNPTTAPRVGAVEGADRDSAAVAASQGGPVGIVVKQAPDGPVLDRLEARVSVGDDGVVVQTEAAVSSAQGQVLAWSSLLLGLVALGWSAFVLLRRRRKVAA
jgi:hypothetical protein